MLSSRPFQCPSALLARAQSAPPVRTAIASAGAGLPLESARLAVEAGVMEPLLVGDRDAITAAAERIDWDIDGFEIVDAADEATAGMAAAKLCGDGAADALMKGHIHTDAFVRGILSRDSGLRTGRRLTHVFHMTVPDDDKALLITDAAINVAPDIETRLQAAANAVDLAIALGIESPKVAVLSASEEATETMPSTLDAAEITARAVSAIPNASVYGPLAFDNAVSPEAAALKGIDHPVAGHADILLVPTIETGNALFKIMVYFMSACAAGIVMGAKVPAILTSRADPPEARLAAAAIASILAQQR
jgi:phosphate acetyltransferase